MKQLIGFACAALLLAGCQKEVVADLEVDNPLLGSAKALSAKALVFYDNPDYGFCYCSGDGGNCYADVVVSRVHATAMNAVITALRTGNQNSIVNAFTTHQAILLNYMEAKDVEYIIDETYRGTAANGANNATFIVIKTTSGTVISAYPMLQE